jgi:hypothetical protein
MDSGRGLFFKERPNESTSTASNDFKFNPEGGGGGDPIGFFSVKNTIYSRECYSDPNNPGKMICKEINNSSGYDPFRKENNFNNSKENIYTTSSQWGGGQYNNHNQQTNYNEPSIFDKV